MSKSNRGRDDLLTTQLDLEEAATTTFQNVVAKSRTESLRNKKPSTDDFALDALEKAVGDTDSSSRQRGGKQKKQSRADVVRQRAGLRGGRIRSNVSGFPPLPRWTASAGTAPSTTPRRPVRRISEAQDLLKAAGVHGRRTRSNSLTKLDFHDVFSQDVFLHDGGVLHESVHEGEDEESSSAAASDTDDEETQTETDPLTANTPSAYGSSNDGKEEGGKYIPSPPRPQRRRRALSVGKRCLLLCCSLCSALRTSLTMRFAIPLAAMAGILILVHGDENIGSFDIFWCFFAAQQLATVDAARILQYLLVDVLFIKSTQYFQLFGPFLTLIAIQSKGWPLLLFFLGVVDMVLFRHGVLHHGAYVVNSEVYLQTIICLVTAGAMTAIKRVVVGITFGARQYRTFAARLDSIVADVVLLNEIATLAAHAESFRHQELDSWTVRQKTKRDRGIFQVRWSCIRKDSVATLVGSGDVEDGQNEDKDSSAVAASEQESAVSFSSSTSTSSRKMAMKDVLYHWEEPETQEVLLHII
jgi:hypothetical protein